MLKYNLGFPYSWHMLDQSFYPDGDKEGKKKERQLLRTLMVTHNNPTSLKFKVACIQACQEPVSSFEWLTGVYLSAPQRI